MTKNLEWLLRPELTDYRGKPVPVIWVGDETYAVCLNPRTNRIYVKMWNAGYGKFYPTVYISIPTVLRILWLSLTWEFGWRRFPRCGFSLLGFKSRSMSAAKDSVQAMLIRYRII
jgi:hypothetical protein